MHSLARHFFRQYAVLRLPALLLRKVSGNIYETVDQLLQEMLSLSFCDVIYRRVLPFVCSMNRKTIYSAMYISVTRERR